MYYINRRMGSVLFVLNQNQWSPMGLSASLLTIAIRLNEYVVYFVEDVMQLSGCSPTTSHEWKLHSTT